MVFGSCHLRRHWLAFPTDARISNGVDRKEPTAWPSLGLDIHPSAGLNILINETNSCFGNASYLPITLATAMVATFGVVSGQTKQSRMVPREINPFLNCSIMMEEVSKDDRLSVAIRDIGMLSESHLMGTFGPKILATTSIPVEDFAGFLELQANTVVANNGNPLLQLEVKARGLSEWPLQGHAMDRTSLFGRAVESDLSSSAHSGGPQPSAPPLVLQPAEPSPEPASAPIWAMPPWTAVAGAPEVQVSGCSGVSLASAPAESEVSKVAAGCSGAPPAQSSEERAFAEMVWEMERPQSFLFHIDQEVFTFAQTGELFDVLLMKSKRSDILVDASVLHLVMCAELRVRVSGCQVGVAPQPCVGLCLTACA